MVIANNSIFKSIMQYFLARSIALKECYLMMNFEKYFIYCFLRYPQKCKFDGQTLKKCDSLEGRLPKYFGGKYIPLVVSKLYTKFQQLSLSKPPSSNVPKRSLGDTRWTNVNLL